MLGISINQITKYQYKEVKMKNNVTELGLHLIHRYGYEYDEKTFLIMENLLNLFMSRYEYDGLPKELGEYYGDPNLFELFLFYAPAVTWFEHPTQGLMVLPVSGASKFNLVGKPTEWRAVALNGVLEVELNEDNAVLMFNDKAKSIPYLHLMYESKFMRKLDMASMQNIDLQSTPYIIEAFDENNKGTAIWEKLLNSFKSRIVLRKSRDKDNRNSLLQSQVLDTRVDLKVKENMTAYNEFLFRAHTYMGIKNVNIEKSERLLTGEVSANDILVQSNYTNGLNTRQKAFDEVEKKFGRRVTVKPTDLKTMVADMHSAYMGANIPNKGGVENVQDRVKTN